MRSTLLALSLLPATALAQTAGTPGGAPIRPNEQPLPDAKAVNMRIDAAIVEPTPTKPGPDFASTLTVPKGFKVNVFAKGLNNARELAVADDGTVYLTRRSDGDVVMLRDTDGDGVADVQKVVAQRPTMSGIAISGSTMYLVALKEVMSATIRPDGTLSPLRVIVDDLPDAGQHSARDVAVGPDGMLWVGVGSTCNACVETSQESATMLRLSPDGKQRAIFASGLRHTIGFDFQPRSGELWGLDQGIDWLGDTEQPEELNHLQHGRNYGWPYIYGFGGENPQDDPPTDTTMAELKAISTPAVLGYTAHAAAMQLKFYRGAMFPAAYQGDAFATFRGSWNRSQPSGYEVVRIRFDAAGTPTGFEPFVTGFLRTGPGGGPIRYARPVGLAVAKDGALLFTDDENGIIYRVSYTGQDGAGTVLPPAPDRHLADEPRPHGPALALYRPELKARGTLRVSSPDFASGGAIPMRFSHYGQRVSPALAWSGAPSGTKAYALMMEDPDASGHPTVHWIGWNIPASTTSLAEAVPGEWQPADPNGLRQGRNSHGWLGYSGPKPPIGDPAHHYHVQLFALDAPLSLLPGADREQLIAAMAGHVLAKGDLVGTYAQPSPPTKGGA